MRKEADRNLGDRSTGVKQVISYGNAEAVGILGTSPRGGQGLKTQWQESSGKESEPKQGEEDTYPGDSNKMVVMDKVSGRSRGWERHRELSFRKVFEMMTTTNLFKSLE